MYYPCYVDYTKLNDKYDKFYDISVIERNCIYPFTDVNIINTNSTIENINYNIYDNNIIYNINDYVELPNFENLTLDENGLPFIQLNK